ncbi:Uncharacterized protein PBTT_09174 [Plasmodiophora brassicae]
MMVAAVACAAAALLTVLVLPAAVVDADGNRTVTFSARAPSPSAGGTSASAAAAESSDGVVRAVEIATADVPLDRNASTKPVGDRRLALRPVTRGRLATASYMDIGSRFDDEPEPTLRQKVVDVVRARAWPLIALTSAAMGPVGYWAIQPDPPAPEPLLNRERILALAVTAFAAVVIDHAVRRSSAGRGTPGTAAGSSPKGGSSSANAQRTCSPTPPVSSSTITIIAVSTVFVVAGVTVIAFAIVSRLQVMRPLPHPTSALLA